MLKVTDAVAREIVKLHSANIDISEIAEKFDLKKIQVNAIIAHEAMKAAKHELHEAVPESTTDELPPPVAPRPLDLEPSVSEETDENPNAQSESDSSEPQEAPGVLIGEDCEYRDLLYWTPENTRLVPNPHMMIVGESGSGKTYSVQCLTAELAHRQIPSIVFDYGQGFETQSLDETFRKHVNPQEYLLGEEGIPLNPLSIFPGDAHGPKSVATRLSDVFDAVYSLGAIQRKVLIDAILLVFERAGITYENKSSWSNSAPPLLLLQEVLEELTANKEYANAKNAVGLSARLTTFFMLASFRSDGTSWSWEHMLNDHEHLFHILQFRGLEGKTQRVLVEILLWHLFFYLKSRGQHPLNFYCILDEAHHLSFRDGGPIDQLLREARKFGVGIIFASQQPEDFSPAAFSNSASKLVFQTADTKLQVSKFIAAKCANYDSADQIHELISVLPKGTALFVSQNRGYKVHIVDLQKRATMWRAQ